MGSTVGHGEEPSCLTDSAEMVVLESTEKTSSKLKVAICLRIFPHSAKLNRVDLPSTTVEGTKWAHGVGEKLEHLEGDFSEDSGPEVMGTHLMT